ncbi:MAG: hypothetical protein WAN33_06190 [Candidatus Acidiferrales bacterium]
MESLAKNDMKSVATQSRSIRRARFVGALYIALILVFTATTIGASIEHQHSSAAAEKTCQICHFAHLRSITPPAQANLIRPTLLHRATLTETQWTYAGPAAFSISPRAPPLE